MLHRFSQLYIFWFLHQTTTLCSHLSFSFCCISFDSYIKPQLQTSPLITMFRCISFDSYIKPQLCFGGLLHQIVVYLLIPTSNHNLPRAQKKRKTLYIFWFLHQTTTQQQRWRLHQRLYIFWFLHQTTTASVAAAIRWSCISFDSYIKPQPTGPAPARLSGCISFDSYIKPQPPIGEWCPSAVVYLLIPTSNHNPLDARCTH